jgi:2-polyprenyl-6-methoxyphenol hydroxylase-like FAD-dependent oxidoreductase
MSKVVVVGAGPVGLATAMLFANDGHEVTVLEKDAQSVPASAFDAFNHWERPGVVQFRQVHHMHARLRHILDAEFPAVRREIEASGGHRFNMLKTLPPALSAPQTGDERFETLTGRRAIIESSFARAAEDAPGLKILRGVAVDGPLTNGSDGPIPHVVGIRTKDGDDIYGDLIIDAMGRRSKFVDWARGVGAREPHEEASDTGFAYYTRHYRSNDCSVPVFRGPLVNIFSTFIVITAPADNDSWAVALVCMSGDKALKTVRDNDVWDRVIRSIPDIVHWLDGKPMHDVIPMGGALDRYRRFVIDGEPVLTGMIAVGDSWACTNPTAGRGVSLGAGHAVALRDVARTLFDDPRGLALEFDRVTEERFTPWYRQQVQQDHARVAAIQAVLEGRDPPPPDLSDPIARVSQAFQIAAAHDPEVARAFIELRSVLALPSEILARPGMMERVLAVAEGRELPQPAGPSRAELVALLDA